MRCGGLRHFAQQNSWWLEDFVLFDALRARYKLESWNHWPRGLAHRDPVELAAARKELDADIRIRGALQFAFYEQWRALRRYCAERAIRIVGDVAIFMNYDSADVWTRRELFRLKDDLEPEVVSGVPPDFFSKTGQRWGNPLYRWDVMKERAMNGGFSACAGRRCIATTSGSITFADSISSGRFLRAMLLR